MVNDDDGDDDVGAWMTAEKPRLGALWRWRIPMTMRGEKGDIVVTR